MAPTRGRKYTCSSLSRRSSNTHGQADRLGASRALRHFVSATAAAELAAAGDARSHSSSPQHANSGIRNPSGHQRTAWWKDEKARAEIGFNADQAAEIDRIFKAYIDKARPLREEVNALEKALSETMKANTADVSVVAQQVDKVENKRAELNKLRVVMLYRMHRVLTPEQNVRLQAYMDRREAERKKQDGDRRDTAPERTLLDYFAVASLEAFVSKTARTLAVAGFILVSTLPAVAQSTQPPSDEHVKALIAQAMQQTAQQPPALRRRRSTSRPGRR